MPITEARFTFAGQPWIVLFESYYRSPPAERKRQESDFRITWTVRKIVNGAQQMCVSGQWSEERGAYSIDRMHEREPDGLIDAALSRYNKAKPYEPPQFAGCCNREPPCSRCRAVKANNRKVRAEIIARVSRLFDTSILTADEPIPHVPDGCYKGKRRERREAEA